MSGSLKSIHPEVRWCIEDVAQQVRRRRWMGAARRYGWLAFAITGLFTAAMWLAGSYGAVGATLAVGYLVALIAAAIVTAIPVLRHPVQIEQVAQFIDEKHPELENRITSAVDLSLHEKEGVSTWLTEKFLEESLERVRQASLKDLIDPRPARSLGYSAAAMGVSCIIMLYLFANVWLPAFSFVIPTDRTEVANLPFTVEPGDVRVRVGDNQMIWVRTTVSDREVIVRWRLAGGTWEELRASPSGTERVYYHQFTDVRQDMEYQVQYGRKRSETFQITAWLPPSIDSINLTYHYPEYLDLPAREVPNSGNISAVEGTNVDVEVYTNKPVESAEVVLESGARLALERLDGTRWRVPIAVTQDDAYHVELADTEGERNEFPTRYTIAMSRDRAPEIKISFPRGDNEVNPLEEVPFDFQVSDDFGFESFGVQYEIAGREPVRVALSEGGTPTTDAAGHHELRLEDVGVEVGDFITWSVWALDTKPDRDDYESIGDPYFLEIKPFKREYREAVSGAGGMGGMGAQQEQRPDQMQKEVLIATWNLRREANYMEEVEFNEKRNIIVDTQDQIIEMVSGGGGALEAPDPDEMKLREAMQGSADSVKRAQLTDYKAALSEATVFQQNALRLLARMKPRDAEVQQMQGGGGGGGGGASERPDISELEMARNRNFYEQESLTREQQQANDQILNKIKELAQRQQHINEELAKLISELQLAKTDEERERLQKELERLKDEMRNNLENMDQARQELTSNNMDTQQARNAQDALERARHQMNRSLELMDRDDLQQARSAGSRASDALEDVEDQLQQFGREAAAQRMNELQRQMRELQEKQDSILEGAKRAQQIHESPSLEQQQELESTQKGIAEKKDQLAEEFVEMMDEASELAQRSAQTQELMSRRLGDWMRETSREGVYEDIHESKPLVDYGIWDSAVTEEQQIAHKLDRAAEQLDSVADALVGDDLEAMQKAMEQLDRLLERDEVARALEERERREGRGAANPESTEEASERGPGEPNDQSEQEGAAGEQQQNSEQIGGGQSEEEREQRAEQSEQHGDQPGGQQQGDPSQDEQAQSEQPGQSQQPGSRSDQGQPGGRPAQSPSSQNRAQPDASADGGWIGADQAMRDFIENGYTDWLDRLNDAESLLPQGTPVRTEVTRLRERIEMMRRDWRARALAPQFDLFLEYAAVPLAETAEDLQREIDRQLSAKEFLAVDEGDVPERYRARVAEYFRRLSEAEGRP